MTVSPGSNELPLAAEDLDDEPWWRSIVLWVSVFVGIGLLGSAADYFNRRRQRTGWARPPG